MDDSVRADALTESIVAKTAKLTDNTSQEMIIVTRDKVELALHRNLPAYVPGGKVLASVGLAIALITTLVTAEFQPTFGIPADTWRGLFIAAFVGAAVLSVIDVAKWLRRPRLDDLVDRIEKDTRVGG